MSFNLQFKQTGSVCRKSASDCDLPEYCTGVSGDCPENSFEMNGKPCNNMAQGYCYNGRCPTHQQHCWRLFGPGTQHAAVRAVIQEIKLSHCLHQFSFSLEYIIRASRSFRYLSISSSFSKFQCHMVEIDLSRKD